MGRYSATGFTGAIGTPITPASTLCVTCGTTTLSTSASCTWTVPVGVTTATFEVWGGGGSGAGPASCYSGMVGSPGGYSTRTLSVTPGTAYTLVAGAGGTAQSSSSPGIAGGTSYVTGPAFTTAGVTFCATGGVGGYRCNDIGDGYYYRPGGIPYGSDIYVGCGSSWVSECWDTFQCGFRGAQTSPMGGGNSLWTTDCAYGSSGNGPGSPGMPGMFPGGGGLPATTCYTSYYAVTSGAGGNGMVKVTF